MVNQLINFMGLIDWWIVSCRYCHIHYNVSLQRFVVSTPVRWYWFRYAHLLSWAKYWTKIKLKGVPSFRPNNTMKLVGTAQHGWRKGASPINAKLACILESEATQYNKTFAVSQLLALHSCLWPPLAWQLQAKSVCWQTSHGRVVRNAAQSSGCNICLAIPSYHSDVTWTSWCLNPLAHRLFVQQFG